MNDNLPEPQFIPLEFQRLLIEQQRENADELLKNLNRRRTVRDFSAEIVPIELIEKAIMTAGTAFGSKSSALAFCRRARF
jgi:hypothetical protein